MMQMNYIFDSFTFAAADSMIRVNKNIKILFKYILAPLLAAWLFYSLYQQISHQPHLHESLELIKKAPFGQEAWKIWTAIFLVFVNWGIEASKWQLLMYPLQNMGFITAFKSVLCGVTLSINTPNRIGEYGGRILYVKEGRRLKSIPLSIAGSISQLIITMLMGCICLLLFIRSLPVSAAPVMGLSPFWLEVMFLISSAVTFLLVLFYFRLSWLVRLVEKIPAAKRWTPYLSVLDHFSNKILLRLLSLSFFRYLVFVIQYILLLQAFDVSIYWSQSFLIICILFLVMAIVPSFAIADLGIRGRFSVALLGIYSANTIGIIGTTFGIWLINLFVPALAGSLLILNIKIFKDNK